MKQTIDSCESIFELPQLALSEIVLKTENFASLQRWYQTVLGLEPFFVRGRQLEPAWTGAQSIAFFRMRGTFPYGQIFAIFEIDGTEMMQGNDPGLHHMQFKHGEINELFRRYELLLKHKILPSHTWDHGPSTSFYYHDPDGNMVELSAPNFENEEEYLGYFATAAYQKNVSGVEIDAEFFIAQTRKLASEK